MTAPANPALAGLANLMGPILDAAHAALTAGVGQGAESAADIASRSQAAASLAQLAPVLPQLAPPGFALAPITAALDQLVGYLRAPSPDGRATAERAIHDIRAALGIHSNS